MSVFRRPSKVEPLPPEPPCPPVLPGEGYGAAILGRSTPEDILRACGREDADVARHTSGEVFQIQYDTKDGDDPPGTRSARPAQLRFAFGFLQELQIDVYQSHAITPDGVRIGTPRAVIEALWGPPSSLFEGEQLRVSVYAARGIALTLSRSSDAVTHMTLFRPSR